MFNYCQKTKTTKMVVIIVIIVDVAGNGPATSTYQGHNYEGKH